MPDASWLWAVFTVIAAAAQTVRNATQRQLTRDLGTVGATHVRFLFGLPFAFVFLALTIVATGASPPRPHAAFFVWVFAGAATQIVATAMMLAAMRERSFAVTIAYTKTEPVQVALFGLVFLGDRLTLWMTIAIVIATGGVMAMSVRPGRNGEVRPVLLGLTAGGFFAFAAVCYRGAIVDLAAPDFLMAASFTLCVALTLQAALLSLYLFVRERSVLLAIAQAWSASLLAGFMGALASQFWFLGFALTSAANVRTLGLVEVLFAQAASRFVFGQRASPREAMGMLLIVAGVALLLSSQ
ncbi:MAG TPA: DMT family transporter [Rhodoplanes sp.]|nr:DMT family transporter [Rhodoplanes sp.]